MNRINIANVRTSDIQHGISINEPLIPDQQYIRKLEESNRTLVDRIDHQTRQRTANEKAHSKTISDLEYELSQLKIHVQMGYSKSPVKAAAKVEPAEEIVHRSFEEIEKLTEKLGVATEKIKRLDELYRKSSLDLMSSRKEIEALVRSYEDLERNNNMILQTNQEYLSVLAEFQDRLELDDIASVSYDMDNTTWISTLFDSMDELHYEIY